MKTYIPRQPKHTRERLEIKLERALLQKLERYCQYLDSDREYVLACVLEIVFKKDKGFADWLRTQPAAAAAGAPVVRAPQGTAG